jgi:hypothetical protein
MDLHSLGATSNLVSTRFLLMYYQSKISMRIILFVYTAVLLIREIHEFSFDTMKNLTNLSWAGFMMYYFLSSFQTYIFVTNIKYPRIGPILLKIQFLLFSALITFPWLVTIVFWTVLIDDFIRNDFRERLLQINFHAFNFVLMITEIIISSNPVNKFSWVFPLACSYMYAFLVAILKFCFNVKW